MREGALLAYVEAIETHLSRLRGRDHMLLPADFSLARAWHAAGVPLAEVLAALDEASGRGEIRSLRAVRRRVEVGQSPAARRGD